MTNTNSSVVALAVEKMIAFYHGNLHDIDHFLKVWAFARTIGEQEHLGGDSQLLLELSAVIHDIACPLCREKYGNTDGKHQEAESPALVDAFFADLPVEAQMVKQISWIAAHHHTYTDVQMIEHRILLEADYLVNADESNYPNSAILAAKKNIFKTATGLRLLSSCYQV